MENKKSERQHIDLLLGETLELLQQSAQKVKELNDEELREKLIHLGNAIGQIWAFREKYYEKFPEIQRDFVTEYSEDKERYEKLNKLHLKAYSAEQKGKPDEAYKAYIKLLEISKYGYFTLIAQAGLYRVEMIIKRCI